MLQVLVHDDCRPNARFAGVSTMMIAPDAYFHVTGVSMIPLLYALLHACY